MTTDATDAAATDGAPMPLKPADPVLERLKALHPKVIDLSLDRVKRLLAALGNPERTLPPVVHVAGTNGKGSTIAFLRAMLEAAGHSVHVYTSPHLVRFNERIRLAGRLIDDEALAALLEEVEQANDGNPITFFEVTTAAAFLAFSRVPADVVLLETGLGGRLDATNVVERPAVTAITRLSYDHQQFLGETLLEIANEKAGIFRRGVPAVLFPQPAAEAQGMLEKRARLKKVPIYPWSVTPTGDGFRFESGKRRLDLPRPALPGPHQIVNAGVAIACLDHLPLAVDDEAVRRGLATVEWPARLQRLVRGPLVEMLPPGWELWLDGGHNDSAGEALALQAIEWHAEDQDRPLLMIYGMLETKDPYGFLAPLGAFVTSLRSVGIPGEPSSLPPEETTEAARICSIVDSAPADSVEEALADLIEKRAAAGKGPARVLICGSLYLAGVILARHG